MATIYLLRHGQASFGQHDYDRLSPLGERQALITGEWLAALGKTFKLAGCGTLLRQQQTLTGVHSGMGNADKVPDLTLPGLNELDVDDLVLTANPEYTDRKALDAAIAKMPNPALAFFEAYRTALARWTSGEHDSEYQESWPQFKIRTLDAIQQTASKLGEHDSAVLVSSGGAISAIMLQLLNIPDDEVFNLNQQIHNASITMIKVRRGKLSLHSFNSYAHLEVKGEQKLLTRI
ncbi:histidine phosphatase family protein [Parendozoicomonas haliclonae]|uniref:2,3-bisphosphoglycerate-dependent phosphoglycerate mutase n=1 Tax=Parendozoicomonas haliclonae TaxID=1960125 RepID=A0A1X7AI14_9GAMM|nr:histidine phosphatase family protein [Parendozoicomonas haliclonae]SMA42712.1 2,3-bisphosphoglycerate-dependent phosphoglycerate mutase [Parendozoicomonas haliclonae]